jgi:nucleotide-binding universal stress UspA family protein
MKILIATDGSRDATTAMTSTSRLVRHKDLQADLLCVAPEFMLEHSAISAGRRRMHSDYADKSTKESQCVVRTAQHVWHGEGLTAKSLTDIGSPADEIIRRSLDYDVVVVGAHGKHERRQPGLGPVASLVVHNSRRTVLVGRELVNENNYRVLVALDGSDASFAALQMLGMNFAVSAFDITLMHIIETPWARLHLEDSDDENPAEPGELDDYRRELERELRLDSDAVMDRGLRQIEKWNVPATTIVAEGDPALELVGHAEEGNYDLVVTGATGNSDVKHAVMGSVSLKVAWNAPCSVLVVRS